MNAVNERLGRHRHRIHAERRRKLEVVNRLAKETDWRGALARSWKEMNADDEFERIYETGEFSR